MSATCTVTMTATFSIVASAYHPPYCTVTMSIPPGVITSRVQAGASYAVDVSVLHYDEVSTTAEHYNNVTATALHSSTIEVTTKVTE